MIYDQTVELVNKSSDVTNNSRRQSEIHTRLILTSFIEKDGENRLNHFFFATEQLCAATHYHIKEAQKWLLMIMWF